MTDIAGGPDNDVLTGTAGADVIHGNGGNDYIEGKGGADALFGDDGDDDFAYRSASDLVAGETIDGGAGFDTIQILTQDVLDFSNFALTGIEGIESVIAGSTGVTAAQLNALEWLRGGFHLTTGGSVSLSGTTVGSGFFRLADVDTIFDLTGMLPLDPGNMTGPLVAGGSGNDRIIGADRNDNLYGGVGNDTLEGGGGNDALYGGEGVDIVRGGEGDDYIQFRSIQDIRAGETYDGGAGTDSLEFIGSFSDNIDLSGVTLTGIERISINGFSSFTMRISQIEMLTETVNNIYLADGGTLTLSGVRLGSTAFITSDNATTIDGTGVISGQLYIEGGTAADTVIGSAFDDILSGGEGADHLSGGEGNDRLVGGLGIDQLDGGAGNDLFVIESAMELLPGDAIIGGSGIDRIEVTSSSFSDRVDLSAISLSGIEEIVRTGYDEVVLSIGQFGSLDLVRGVFHLSTGGTLLLDGIDADNSIIVASDSSTTIDARGAAGILNLMGGAAADQLIANNNRGILHGMGGNDRLTGGLGADQLYGEDGDDILIGGTGNDELWGGAGINNIDGGAGSDVIYIEPGFVAGSHVLNGGADLDILKVTSFDADISAASLTSIERIEIAAGKLTLTVAQMNGVSALLGTGGSFALSNGGSVSFAGREVSHTNFYLSAAGNIFDLTGVLGSAYYNVYGGVAADTITGAGGNDSLHGDAGNDTLSGAGGDDLLYGGIGRDTLRGGEGNDIFFVDAAAQLAAGEIYDGGAGNDKLQFYFGDLDVNVSNSSLAGIEEIEMFFGGRLSLTAAQLDQATNIHHGTFVLTTAGAVSMSGVAAEGALFILSDLGNNFDLTGYLGGAGNVTGGAGADTIIGTALTDLLSGGGGNDVLQGGEGNDSLTGGAGADNLYGGLGNDHFYVDRTDDLVFENAGEGIDTAFSSGNFYLYANVENLTLTGTTNIFGVGNELANTLLGNGGENLLIAGAGDDVVRGGGARDSIFGQDGIDQLFGDAGVDYIVAGSGNDIVDGGTDADEIYGEDGDDTLSGGAGFFTDILVGGAGNDIVRGDSGLGDYDRLYGNQGDDSFYVDTPDDLVFESAGEGIDTVYANIQGAGYYLYANIENLVLQGNTPFGVGNALANRMTGSDTANYLLGGAGNDTLNGKGGNDVLFGEAGDDIFVFESGTGSDVIGDFVRGEDLIDLSAYGFTEFSQISSRFIQGGDVGAIQFANGDVIVLHNVQMNQLTAGDFIFAAAAKETGLAAKAATDAPFLSFEPHASLAHGERHGGELWQSHDYDILPLFG